MARQIISLNFDAGRVDIMVGLNMAIIRYTLADEIIMFNLLDTNATKNTAKCIGMLADYGLISHYGKDKDLIFLCGKTKVTIECGKGLGLVIDHEGAGFVSMVVSPMTNGLSEKYETIWNVAYSKESYFDLPETDYEDLITRYDECTLNDEGSIHCFIHKQLHYTGTIH